MKNMVGIPALLEDGINLLIYTGEVLPCVRKICTSLGKRKKLKSSIAISLENIISISESLYLRNCKQSLCSKKVKTCNRRKIERFKFEESSFIVDTCARKCEESSISSELPLPYMKKPFDEKLDTVNCDRDYPLSITLLSKPGATIVDHYSSGSKSPDHNDSFKASMDEVKFEKVSSPECIRLNSDSLLHGSFLPPCYPPSETGDDTNKTVSTSCAGRSTESFLDLDYCQQQTTPC